MFGHWETSTVFDVRKPALPPGTLRTGWYIVVIVTAIASVSTLPAQEASRRTPAAVHCECSTSAATPQQHQRSSLRPTIQMPPSNTGLVIDIHEELLNRIVRRTDQRESPVRDFVLGADVHGVESTTTTARVDLQPSSDGVALDLLLSGRNRAHTVGYTPQAAIRTLGQHRFTARKLIVHDGRLFRTARPRVDVSPSNQTLGVATPVSGVPLLGDIAASIGFQAAESQRAQGEAIAAQRIRDRVGTEFNRQIDAQLTQLNQGWVNQLGPQLRRFGFGDIEVAAQSTDDWARYSLGLASARRTTQSVRQRVQRPIERRGTPVRRVVRRRTNSGSSQPFLGRITVRDAVVNDALSRLKIAGATFQTADFAEPATTALRVLDALRDYGLVIADVPPEAAAALRNLTIRFDEQQPLRVAFTRDLIWVRARASLAIPPLIDLPGTQITVRYRIEDTGTGSIRLAPDNFELKPADANAPPLGPLALLLESQATSAMPLITLPRDIEVPIPDAEPLRVSVVSLRSDNRRLTLTVR